MSHKRKWNKEMVLDPYNEMCCSHLTTFVEMDLMTEKLFQIVHLLTLWT